MNRIRNVPFVDLVSQHAPLREELHRALDQVLSHGQFVFGPEVAEFEKEFASYCGTRFAIGLNSGLDALILALRALGVGHGDEVITPPNSYIASSGAIGLLGASPVFVDVGDDYNIDPTLIENAITPKTKAIMPVHLTGRPCDMDAISAIAEKHALYVVEDAAQSVGARYKEKPTGSLGDIGCFSLHPLKTLNACGDAGIITTDDAELKQRILRLRNHGLKNRDECAEWGYNSRLDSLQAAFLNLKLRHLSAWTEKRRTHAMIYQQELRDLNGIICPSDRSHEYAAYHTFIIRADRRDDLQRYLNQHGIGAGVHYPIPIHVQESAASLGFGPGDMPKTEQQADEILSLPVHQNLSDDDIRYVCLKVRAFYAEQ